MADRWEHTTDGYSFRFFSPEQVDQILRDGFRRGREGSHAAINRILKHEPGLARALLWQRIRRLKSSPQVQKRQRATWSPEDEKLLREGYGDGWRGKREAVRKLLRRHPDWRPHLIWRRAAKLGLVGRPTKKRPERYRCHWSEEDDRVLLNLAGYRKLRMIAKLLHRSERGVRYRLAFLGKSSRVHVDGYARRSLAEQLHFGRRTIQRLIVAGMLEVRDPRITPESLQLLRRSGRLTSLQVGDKCDLPVLRAGIEQKAAAQGQVGSGSPDVNGMAATAPRYSRAKRVWNEVAQALGLALETVEDLIVERVLKLYDPRITERSLIKFCRQHGALINWEFLDGETRRWLESSMSLNRGAGAATKVLSNPARKHARVVRKCKDCGLAIRGNAFFSHAKCRKPRSTGSNAVLPGDELKDVGQSG